MKRTFRYQYYIPFKKSCVCMNVSNDSKICFSMNPLPFSAIYISPDNLHLQYNFK